MTVKVPLIIQENEPASPLLYSCSREAIASDQMGCKVMKRSKRNSGCKSKSFKRHVFVWDATVPSTWTSQEPPDENSPSHTFTLLNSYSGEYSKKEAYTFYDALKASPELKTIQSDLAFIVSSVDSFALQFLVKAVIARHLFSDILKTKKGVDILSHEMTEAIDYYSQAISAFALASYIPPHLHQNVKSLLDELLDITNKFIN
ncbi:hypothetical protein DSO57_1004407 [Entomophthora muscae]|uniref:Uncharacterized protein n=1 Tax=Entomophthora muscae TaxID=34485 RepID=A0ACC2SY07_9FUNG|nr:hypothetical protein DSO57_1004407 [Entomophthora muscae]